MCSWDGSRCQTHWTRPSRTSLSIRTPNGCQTLSESPSKNLFLNSDPAVTTNSRETLKKSGPFDCATGFHATSRQRDMHRFIVAFTTSALIAKLVFVRSDSPRSVVGTVTLFLQVDTHVLAPPRFPSTWTVRKPRCVLGRAAGDRWGLGGPWPTWPAAAVHSDLRGTERARTATAHEVPRLDARRDSVSDHDRPMASGIPLGPLAGPARLHTPHQPSTRPMPDEAVAGFSQTQRTPSHLNLSLSHDSWTAGHSKSTHHPWDCCPLPNPDAQSTVQENVTPGYPESATLPPCAQTMPRHGASSYSRWKDGFHSLTSDAYVRPARHLRPSFSYGTAPPAAQQSLKSLSTKDPLSCCLPRWPRSSAVPGCSQYLTDTVP